MSLTIERKVAGDSVVLSVNGEVDVANAAELTTALNDAFDSGATSIEVDVARMPYIDSTGVGVLMAASKRAGEGDVKLKVSHPQPSVLRVFTLLGVVSEFDV